MEEKTCMEYLFQSVQSDQLNNINQNILFYASNEFRNVWNLVKKLRDLARVDVQKITRFLDAVQEGIEKKNWNTASRQCIQAENEYKQIRRYIRPSVLDDFKVSLFIENVGPNAKSKSGTKREKKPPSPAVNLHRRQNFRNKQINKQKSSDDPVKKPDTASTDEKKQKEAHIKDKSKLKDKGNNIEFEESSKLKENAICEISSKNMRKTESVTISALIKDSLDETNTEHRLVTNADVPPNTISDAGRQNGDGASNDIRNSENETKTGLNEDGSKTHPTLKMRNDNDNIKEKEIVINTKEDEVSQNGHSAEAGKRSDATTCSTDKISEEKMRCVENNTTSSNPVVTHVSANEEVLQNEDISANDQHSANNQTEESVMPKSINILDLVSEQMTEISYDCRPEEIITELYAVYDTDWNLAYKALTGCQPSNGMKNSIDFLGEILQLSADDVRKYAELKPKVCENVPDSVAGSLEKLKQEFLTQHLKKLQRGHCIEYHTGTDAEYIINVYSAKCVELSWFMFTRQPPMVFDYDSRPMLLEDLFEIFKPYKNTGHYIHYVVWPAIRRCHGGHVVAQGIAEFR